MPVTEILNPNSQRKKALYASGRKLYANNSLDRPSIQDEIELLPISIINTIRSLIKPNIQSNKKLHLTGGASFNGKTISTKEEWIILNKAIYYIEAISFEIHADAKIGFLEIKLREEEGDPIGLDFWDSEIDRAVFKEANSKRINKVIIQENYSSSEEEPSVSEGFEKWISYKANETSITELVHIPTVTPDAHSAGLISQTLPHGLMTGKASIDADNFATIESGTYDVDGQKINIEQNIKIDPQTHNYGSGAYTHLSWYLVLLSNTGEVKVEKYLEENNKIENELPIRKITKDSNGIAKLHIPNSFDLSDLISAYETNGISLFIHLSNTKNNNGFFQVTSIDNTPDSATTGYKSILITNSHIEISSQELDISINAQVYTYRRRDTFYFNPKLRFDETRNGYYSEILENHRVLGIFYVNAIGKGKINILHSLTTGKEWFEGFGKSVGTIYPIYAVAEPPWGLYADGASVAIADYPELYLKYGNSFGSASAGMFRLPDARGHFIRFQSLGSSQDPDLSQRRREDGAVGDFIGTKQKDALKGHKHNDRGHTHTWQSGAHNGIPAFWHSSTSNYGSTITNTGYANLGDPVATNYGTPSLSIENRPKNILLAPIIKI